MIKKEATNTEGQDYSELIHGLRTYLQLSQAAFAKQIGLSPTHVARFEKGVSTPSSETIEKICREFGVNHKYFEKVLSGASSVADAVKKKDAKSGIAERLKTAREEKGWNQHELGRRAQVAASLINRVEFGANLTPKQGIKIAEALEIGYAWLMEGDEKKHYFPADQKMNDWLWAHEDIRKELWKKMNEEDGDI